MLRWLYPITCELCRETSSRALCPACLAALQRVPRPICLYCGSCTAGEQTDPYRCAACSGSPRCFDFARSALIRTESVMQLIRKLKYHRASYLASALSPALAELWQTTPELRTYTDAALVPVPITRTRLFGLGYNHAEELATSLGKLADLPVLTVLCRRESDGGSQTGFSAAARMRHAEAIYTAAPAYARGHRTLPARLLVIDDVYTTGATARACAAVLKRLPGVRSVGVLTVVRA